MRKRRIHYYYKKYFKDVGREFAGFVAHMGQEGASATGGNVWELVGGKG